MSQPEEGSLKLGTSLVKDEDREQEMAKAIENITKAKPLTLIAFVERAEGGVLCLAVGGPLDITAVHEVGTKQLAAMLRVALHPTAHKLNG